MKKNIIIVILFVLLFAGCSSSYGLRTNNTTKEYQRTSSSKIEIYSTDVAKKDYDIIGPVLGSADVGNSSDKPVLLLKREAAKLGADAVINLKLEYTMGVWAGGVLAKGIAIKYKD
jgi:hypothetical protein